MAGTSQAPLYDLPPNWRKPTFNTTHDVRVKRASAALQKNVDAISVPSSQFIHPAVLAGQLVELDGLIEMPYQYDDTVRSWLNSVQASAPGFVDQNVSARQFDFLAVEASIWYGYAAINAYLVYGDSFFLQIAELVWETGNGLTISEDEVAAGSANGVALAVQCSGASLVGGTFAFTQKGNINAITVEASANFLILSSLLANTTGNDTYLRAATQSFQFMHTHLYSAITGMVTESVLADSCKLSAEAGGVTETAFFLEGAAILGSITKNGTLEDLAIQLAAHFITNTTAQDGEGIIHQGRAGHNIIRALTTLFELNPESAGPQNYLKAFLAVQYNALIDLAGDGQDTYSGSWSGPVAPYSFDNQTAAIDILLGGLSVANANPTSSSAPPMSTPTTQQGRSVPVGTIAGGVVGGTIVFVLMVSLAVLIFRSRRRRRKQSDKSQVESFESTQPTSPESPVTSPELLVSASITSSYDLTPSSREKVEHDAMTATEGDDNESRAPDRILEEQPAHTLRILVQQIHRILDLHRPEGWSGTEVPPAYGTPEFDGSVRGPGSV